MKYVYKKGAYLASTGKYNNDGRVFGKKSESMDLGMVPVRINDMFIPVYPCFLLTYNPQNTLGDNKNKINSQLLNYIAIHMSNIKFQNKYKW